MFAKERAREIEKRREERRGRDEREGDIERGECLTQYSIDSGLSKKGREEFQPPQSCCFLIQASYSFQPEFQSFSSTVVRSSICSAKNRHTGQNQTEW